MRPAGLRDILDPRLSLVSLIVLCISGLDLLYVTLIVPCLLGLDLLLVSLSGHTQRQDRACAGAVRGAGAGWALYRPSPAPCRRR